MDVNGVRGAIGQWPSITWEPVFPVVRHLLGFHHPTTGELLCPVTLDWNDPRQVDIHNYAVMAYSDIHTVTSVSVSDSVVV